MRATLEGVVRPFNRAVVGAVLVVVVLLPRAAPAQIRQVPEVRHRPLEQALQVLEENRLQGVVQNPSDRQPLMVIRQFPAPGAAIPDDRIVRLWVRLDQSESVPSITGLEVRRAQLVLREMDLIGREIGRELSAMETGLIARQEPDAGSPVPRDRVIRFWVSAGQPDRFTVGPSIEQPPPVDRPAMVQV